MNRRYLLAAALLIATAASASAQSVRAGIDAWQRADYAHAVAIWRPLAEKGDADAQFNLGQAYRLGRGVAINLAAAKSWFERAANQGHVDAQTTLGLLLFQNGEQADGIRWLKKAAEHDEPRAQLVYGTALVNGDGVTQDPVLGYAYIRRAAAQGLQPAQETLQQLDQMLSAADRKRGIAIARNLASQPFASNSPAPKRTRQKSAPPSPQPEPAKAAPKVVATQSGPKTTPKPAPVAGSGAWRIQLGAFSQRGSAEALYQKLAGKTVLSGRRPFYIPVGSITRLQAGPFESKGAAQAACSALGVPCFPVGAK